MTAVREKSGILFVRCSEEEAERIRHAAKSERRTVSGYILNVVLNRIEAKEKLLREGANQSAGISDRSSTQKPFLS